MTAGPALSAQAPSVTALPASGVAVEIRATAALTAAWVATPVVGVRDARTLTLEILYDAAEGTTAGQAQIIALGSNAAAAPLVADDQWVALGAVDASPTDAVLTGTMPTGFDPTITPEWGVYSVRPGVLETLPTDAGTDKIRIGVPLDVTGYRFVCVLAKEVGDVEAPGLLGLRVAKAT